MKRCQLLICVLLLTAFVSPAFVRPAQAADSIEGVVSPGFAPFTLQAPADTSRALTPTQGAQKMPEISASSIQDDWAYDPTSGYDQKGMSAPRGFSSGAPTELVDPFSGNLILRHTDFTLPGVAGLDLKLQRVYNSKIHRNYAARASGNPTRINTGMLFVPTSPLGLGWSMHLGRLVGFEQGGPNNGLNGPRYYEKPDGSQHPYFNFTGEGCGDESEDICFVTKAGDNPYKLDDQSPWQIATADGLNMTFDHTAFDGASIVHYVTEIRDVHGNRIRISYHDETIPGISIERDYFRNFMDVIIDSSGRTINFGYSEVNPDVVRLTSISAVARTLTYGYTADNPWPAVQAFLSRVQPPEGAPWRYDYAGLYNGECTDNSRRWCELTQVTYPTGGVFDYEYTDAIFWMQQNAMSARTVTRRTVSGRQLETGAWTYVYNRAADYRGEEHTIVTRPDGSQEISTFFGIGNATYNPFGQNWKIGSILRKEIRNGDGDAVQVETFDWIAGDPISNEIWGDPWSGFSVGVQLPWLQQHTIERGDLRWVLTNTHFNRSSNMPRCWTETGDGGATRYGVRAYYSASDLIQNGGYIFRVRAKPALEFLSYQFPGENVCDDDQEAPFSPAVGDEFGMNFYDANGRPTTALENGAVTEFTYHADGSVKDQIIYRTRNADGSLSDGYCTTFADYLYATPRRTQYGAQAPGCTNPVYQIDSTVNTDGTVAQSTTAEGETVSYTYDGLARVKTVQPQNGPLITIRYDGNSDTSTGSRRVEQGSYWIESSVDGMGRKIREVTSTGLTTVHRYNALGYVTFKSRPSAAEADATPPGDSYVYDALGRMTRIVHADGGSIDTVYATDAHVVTVTDPLGRQTIFTRRAFADPEKFQLVRLQQPDEETPVDDTYEYLVGGHLFRVNHAGRVRTLQYNYLKKVIYEELPEAGAPTFYGYDIAGNLLCKSLRGPCLNDPNASARFTLDALGKVVSATYAGGQGDVAFNSDSAGRVTSVTHGGGENQFTYLPTGRLASDTRIYNEIAYTTAYTYDARGNTATITYPSGRIVSFEYDDANRLVAIPGYIDAVTSHSNDIVEEMTYANGVITSVTLDDQQQPDRLQVASVFDLRLSYDGDGNVLESRNTLGDRFDGVYQYDGRNRLTRATDAGGAVRYAYNAAGDRTSRISAGASLNYQYSAAGRLEAVSGPIALAYTYDGQGSVIGRGGFLYSYNADRALDQVLDANRNVIVRYRYDASGNQAHAGYPDCGTETIYIYDQKMNRIAESTGSGLLLKETIWAGGNRIVDIDLSPLQMAQRVIDVGEIPLAIESTFDLPVTNRSASPITIERVVASGGSRTYQAQPTTIAANSSGQASVLYTPDVEGEFLLNLALCAEQGMRLPVQLRGAVVNPQVATSTAPNGSSQAASAPLETTYEQPLDATSVTPRTYAVFGMQTGLFLTGYTVDGSRILFTANGRFKAGETVHVSSTRDLQYSDGSAPLKSKVWQFTITPSQQGMGSFEQSIQSAANDMGNIIVNGAELGDLDGDGDLDLFLAMLLNHDGTQGNEVWFNDGRGNFSDSGQRLGNRWSEEVALGDLDGDGDLDAFVANSGTNRAASDNRVWINDGAGNFSDSGQSLADSESRDVALGDMDGDGDLDAIVVNADVIVGLGSPINRLWLNDGAGGFTIGQALGSGRTMGVAIGDVNNDGFLDAFITNIRIDRGSAVFLNQGDGLLRQNPQLELTSSSVQLADLDSDGDLDAVLDRVTLTNDGFGNFSNPIPLPQGITFGQVGIGDLDGDGDPDIYMRSGFSGDSVLLNENGNFLVTNQVIPSAAGNGLGLGDIDGDGAIDIVMDPANTRLNRPLDSLPVDLPEKLYLPLARR